MGDEAGCVRCGLCCYLVTRRGTKSDKPCKHLIFMSDGKTKCKVYRRNRVGRLIGDVDGFKNRCVYRKEDPNNYDGCPLNH